MSIKELGDIKDSPAVPPIDLASLPANLGASAKFGLPVDEEMSVLGALRSHSDPWARRGETPEQSLEFLTKLRPFVHVARLNGQAVGYVTVERDGPVQGAAYMRNIVVKPELRRRKIGTSLFQHAVQIARDMHRRTVALRVDPANAPAVSFYRSVGFTTVATVVSKKSGKLRLLMSREL